MIVCYMDEFKYLKPDVLCAEYFIMLLHNLKCTQIQFQNLKILN